MFGMELKKKKIEIEVIDFDSMSTKELAMYGVANLLKENNVKEMIESGRGEEAAINAYNELMYMAKVESQIKELESENK